MARRDTAKTQQEAAVDEMARDDEMAGDTGPPALADGHDQIVEEAPGIGAAAEMSAPMGDPGDLSAFGRSTMLPDDLGTGDDSGFGGPVDPGTDLGSTLLDDLAGDLSDPSDGFGGMSDGSGPGVLDDQRGFTMDGGGSFPYGTGPPDIGQWDTVTTTTEVLPSGAVVTETSWEPAVHDDDPEEGQSSHGTEQPGAGTESGTDDPWFGNTFDPDDDGGLQQDETESPTSYQVRQEPSDTDEDEEDEQGQEEQESNHERQTSDGPTQGSGDSMPAPDDGTGGGGDFIGGRGDVDPAPEAEDHGGGELIGGRGDVDPLDGESTLLVGDTGDLAEMAAEADLGDVEVEFDDSLVDADIGEDV